MKSTAFVVNKDDNVGVLLNDTDGGAVHIIGAINDEIIAIEKISHGHKIALKTIGAKSHIIKFGVPIGYATHEIMKGEWVHLHNCHSEIDERSNTLEITTGAPTDTIYE